MSSNTEAISPSRLIVAERFKTKLCRNYSRLGACPYEHRCMFAHGELDLRTKDMNIRDGLVTEDAIKFFQRKAAPLTPGGKQQLQHDPYSASVVSDQPCQCPECLGQQYYTAPPCNCPDCLRAAVQECNCEECLARLQTIAP